ncbi:YrzI family small protein [Metabacillus sp. 84]
MTIHLLFLNITFHRNVRTREKTNYDQQVKSIMESVKNRQLML